MLEILVCEENEITEELYKSLNLEYRTEYLAIRAMDKEKCLGFALFSIDGCKEKETVFAVEPKNDRMLADGLLRSALHVGCERGIEEAYYFGDDYAELYEKINFIENENQKKLKLQNLFTDCCSCKNQEK